MGQRKIKLGATLSFDMEKERDILQHLDKLKSRHRLGEFISQCLRLVFENRELAEKCGLNLDRYGLSDNRKKFFEAVHTEIERMNTKIDDIYDMAYKTYTLAQFNKKIGLEDKSKNVLQAQFLLQKQMREMCKVLGVDDFSQLYSSNKMYNLEKNVDETLEFIINFYDGIVNELRENIVQQSTVTKKQYDNEVIDFGLEDIKKESKEEVKSESKQSINNVEHKKENTTKVEETEDVKDTENKEDSTVEFQTTNIDALLNFIQ